jgi:hypothetical protein
MPNTLTPEQSASQSTMLSQLASAKQQLLSIQKGMQSLPEIDMSKAPPLGLDTTNITNALAGNIAQGTGTINQVTQATQKPQTQTTSQGFLQSLASNLPGAKKPEPLDSTALYNQTLAQFGQSPESFAQIQNYLGQMTNVQNEIAKLEDQKALALGNAELEGQGYLESRVQGRLAIIERQYNSRIAAKSTVAGMIAQQYSMAMGAYQQAAAMSKDIVDMATYDQKQKVDDFKWTFDTYKDLFTMMDNSEYRQWQKGQTEAEFEYTKAQDKIRNQISWYTATHEAPSQYSKEWEEAGGLSGTGMTKAEWIMKRTEVSGTTTSDEYLRSDIRDIERSFQADNLELAKEENKDKLYEMLIDEINLSDISAEDKAREIFLIKEKYGKLSPAEIQAMKPVGPVLSFTPQPFGGMTSLTTGMYSHLFEE